MYKLTFTATLKLLSALNIVRNYCAYRNCLKILVHVVIVVAVIKAHNSFRQLLKSDGWHWWQTITEHIGCERSLHNSQLHYTIYTYIEAMVLLH